MSNTIAKKWPTVGFFDLFSPLPPAECVARLNAITRYEPSPIEGSVKKDNFRICLRYQPWGGVQARNSFQPYLSGKLRDLDGGTIIHCHFTLHPLVIGLLVFMCCFAVVVVIMSHDWRFISILLVPIIFVSVGSAVSWTERELIMSRLGSAINARFCDRGEAPA